MRGINWKNSRWVERWAWCRIEAGRVPLLWAGLGLVAVLLVVEGCAWAWALLALAVATILWIRHWPCLVAMGLLAGGASLRQIHLTQDLRALGEAAARMERIENAEALVTELKGTQASLRLEGKWGGARVLARTPGDWQVGDWVRLTGHLRQLERPQNPGGFDAWDYYRREGVGARFLGESRASERAWSRGLAARRWGNLANDWMSERMSLGLEEHSTARGIILGIVLGRQADLDDELREDFRRSGAMHVFSVSGLHVGMLALIVWGILRWFRVDRHRLVLPLLLLVWAYVGLTGFGSAAMRAALMSSALMIGLPLRRASVSVNRLALAALLLLLWEPHSLFQLGFQLSFGVMLAILCLSDLLSRHLPWRYPIDPWLPRSLWTPQQIRRHAWQGQIRGSLVVTLAAWVGSAPLLWRAFQEINLGSFVSSLPLIFGSFVVLSLGLLSALVSVFSPSFAQTVVGLNAHMATLLEGVARPIGQSSWAVLDQRERLTAGKLCLLDLEQGECVLVGGSPDGLIWDCGHMRQYEWQLLPALRYFQFRGKTLVLSHGDAWHVGGAAEWMQDRGQGSVVWLPQGESRSPSLRRVHEVATARGISLENAESGLAFPLGDGVQLRVIKAGTQVGATELADDRQSIGLWEAGGMRVLLAGDAGWVQLQALADQGHRAEVLILGKHRKDSGSDLSAILALHPRCVLFTDPTFPGEEIRSEAWKQALRERGICVWSRRETGAIWIERQPGAGLNLRSIHGARFHLPEP